MDINKKIKLCEKIHNKKKWYIHILLIFDLIYLSIFSYFIYLIIQERINPDIKKVIEDSKELFQIIIGLIILFIPAAWFFMYYVLTLSISNNYWFNLYRSLKKLNLYFFFTFKFNNISKKISIDEFNSNEVGFFKFMSNNQNKYALQGSASIKYRYNDFYRDVNDFDFLATTQKQIDLKNLSYENLNIESNYLNLGKGKYYNKSVELINVKIIPQKSIYLKDGVMIPNLYWMFAMKYSQIFKLIQSYNIKDTIPNYDNKLNNSLKDLAFLLTKKNIFSKKMFCKELELLITTNYFLSLVIKEKKVIDLSDEDQQQNLINFIKTFNFNDSNLIEVKLWLSEINNIIFNNKRLMIISKYMNSNTTNMSNLLTRLDNEKIITNVDNYEKIKVKINTQRFLSNYQEIDFNYHKDNLYKFLSSFEHLDTKNNESEIDIRLILIYDLIKELNKNE
ncbi:hypothetical protein MCRO_0424 [Mycoplasma crocodyli MP145]|uniref:Uncharacterized protein n=1 Tax=Mycoplasma crocodyli (strain ATCC 51981 / MP145) TaxID=512564 RepID=D5E5L1_MYCCM|nr:hypothetical protein MCRO_0424 [Mycoplasma crocodyli MP145]